MTNTNPELQNADQIQSAILEITNQSVQILKNSSIARLLSEHIAMAAIEIAKQKDERGAVEHWCNSHESEKGGSYESNLINWVRNISDGRGKDKQGGVKIPNNTIRILTDILTSPYFEEIDAKQIENGGWNIPLLVWIEEEGIRHFKENNKNIQKALQENQHPIAAVHMALVRTLSRESTSKRSQQSKRKSTNIKLVLTGDSSDHSSDSNGKKGHQKTIIDMLFKDHPIEDDDDRTNKTRSFNPNRESSSQEDEDEQRDSSSFHDGFDHALDLGIEDMPKIPYRPLVQHAREGKAPPTVLRQEETDRIVHILTKCKSAYPVLLGETGTGKTAIIRGLARLISEQDPLISEELKEREIVEFPIYVFGAKQFLAPILSSVQREQQILFVDGIHNLIEAKNYSANAKAGQSGEILKSYLNSVEMKIIGTSTIQEWKETFENNPALGKFFTPIPVKEPSPEILMEILKAHQMTLQMHHNVLYSDQVLKDTIELGRDYLKKIYEPYRSVDLLDVAGTAVRIAFDREEDLKTTKKDWRRNVEKSDIEKAVSKLSGIPTTKISKTEKISLVSLEDDIQKVVFGQRKAVKALVQGIQNARIGFRKPGKPVACLLLVGETGTGKTETAYALSQATGRKIVRLDMSEFAEHHSISSLIGAPPGYVGYGDRNRLTDEVQEDPEVILLFDEIEKANGQVKNVLLGLMDAGSITNRHNTGEEHKADFSRCMILMTSNTGSREASANPMGFDDSNAMAISNAEKALNREFRPEFRNRFDAIIRYESLTEEVLKKIANKFLVRSEEAFKKHGITLEVSDKALDWLAENGHEHGMGARPMERLIEKILAKANTHILEAEENPKKIRLMLTMPAKNSKETEPDWKKVRNLATAKKPVTKAISNKKPVRKTVVAPKKKVLVKAVAKKPVKKTVTAQDKKPIKKLIKKPIKKPVRKTIQK